MSAPISNKSISEYIDNKFSQVYAQCMNESISNIITDIRNRINKMKFTATELSRNPNKVFRAAYDAKGEPITIVHGQYSEGFEIRLKSHEPNLTMADTGEKLQTMFDEISYRRRVLEHALKKGNLSDSEKNELVLSIFHDSILIDPLQMPGYVTIYSKMHGYSWGDYNGNQSAFTSDINECIQWATESFMKKNNVSDEQKILMINGLTHGCQQSGLTCTPIDGLPGYAIISENKPDLIRGPLFRWTNYQMRNGFADSFEECEAKARAHAARDNVHE